MSRRGETKKKITLFLTAGLTLGLSGSPRRSFQILKSVSKEWEELNRQSLKRAIKNLYMSKLISEKQNQDGTITMTLTDKGKEKALTYNLEEMEIKKPERWDGKWRIALFDVPEKMRKIRDAFRHHLNQLGFYEFQKSVFVYPFDCWDEIEYLIEFYNARKFIRFIVAESIDNELHLKSYFKLQ